jgi:hypothetical protein
MTESNQRVLDLFFEEVDEDANDLAERLQTGDDESVFAWFQQRYPKAMDRVSKKRQWREFVAAVRDFYTDQ